MLLRPAVSFSLRENFYQYKKGAEIVKRSSRIEKSKNVYNKLIFKKSGICFPISAYANPQSS